MNCHERINEKNGKLALGNNQKKPANQKTVDPKKLKKGDDVLNTFKERSNYLKAIALMSIFTFIFLGIEYLFVDMISLLVSENRVVLSQNYVLGMSCLGFILYPLYNRYFKGLSRKICIVISTTIIGLITIFYLHPIYPLTLITGLVLFLFLGGLGSITSSSYSPAKAIFAIRKIFAGGNVQRSI